MRKILVLFFTLTLSSFLFAAAPLRGVFFEAKKGTTTFYFFGTIHLGKKDFYPLPDIIIQKFKDSSLLAVELELNDPQNSDSQRIMLQKAMLPPTTSLNKILSPPTYQKVQAFAKRHALSTALLENFKPWLVALTLTLSVYQKAGLQEKQGLDSYFLNLAKKSKKPIAGLETFEYQLGLFDNLSYPEQEIFLQETLNELEKSPDALNLLISAWKSGDLIELEKYLIQMDQKNSFYQKFYEKILYTRNQEMIEKLLKWSENHTKPVFFIAVGALHLIGKRGIISLLEKEGFEIKQF